MPKTGTLSYLDEYPLMESVYQGILFNVASFLFCIIILDLRILIETQAGKRFYNPQGKNTFSFLLFGTHVFVRELTSRMQYLLRLSGKS